MARSAQAGDLCRVVLTSHRDPVAISCRFTPHFFIDLALGRMKNGTRLVLQVSLFVPLFLVVSLGHSTIAFWLSGLPYLFHTRTLQLTAILASSVLAGAAVAAIFAYPFAWLYQQWSVVVASITVLLSAAWSLYIIGQPHGSHFLSVALAVQVSSLVLFLPVTVWMLRRLRPNISIQRTRYARR